jgi:AAA family ATP:ADP antiporter
MDRLRRMVDVRPEERRALAWSFLYFFCLLTAYYILRPIRDERGVFVGPGRLTWLYSWTFATMVVVVPLWSAVVARVPRAVLVPWLNRFFVATLVGFFVVFHYQVAERVTAQVFFVWLSVFNYFAVAVFWGLMADVFRHEQGKRLFGVIAAGGSAGAIVGPTATQALVGLIPPAYLLLVAAVLLEVVARCARPIVSAAAGMKAEEKEEAVGGGAFSGIKAVFASPYLLAIAAYTLFASSAGTWGYNLQARLVQAAAMTPAVRTAYFARLDLIVNVGSIIVQAVVVRWLLKRLGPGAVLAIIPPLSSLSFAALAGRPLLGVASALQATRRVMAYGLWGPAGNVLFTVVDREQKYKAKAFIELVVYRGGDALTSWVVLTLLEAGLGIAGTAWAAVPIGVIWLGVAVIVGRQHRRIAEEQQKVR